VEWEVIGFQMRSETEEGVEYPWAEYVLFHPERGFRYLTEENGHWTDAVPLRSNPKMGAESQRPTAAINGETFKHFATGSATTTFVLGEFPWLVHVGDQEEFHDYVNPPRMLSAEDTAGETAWSLAEYLPARTVWSTFGLAGEPPAPTGVYACQPSAHKERAGRYGRMFWTLAALWLVLGLARCATAGNDEVLRESHRFDPRLPEDSGFVETRPIVLTGRPANLQVKVDTDLDNAWAFFSYQLVNEETGRSIDFAREVSRYHGVEDGESWGEGSSSDDVTLPTVPAGRYQLRIDPEGEIPVAYTVTVTRDVPVYTHFILAFILLTLPALAVALSSVGFESSRWSESDYAPDDDDDD
jgi:hypothetical protein